MRPATSFDILEERPSSWPDPPPGFSTRRILGPGDDYNTNAMDDDEDDYNRNDNGGHRQKRRRHNSDNDRNSKNNNNNNNNSRSNNNNRGRGNATGKRRERGSDSNGRPSTSDLLEGGLSGGRAGYTVEEMEAMRAAKKNATSN